MSSNNQSYGNGLPSDFLGNITPRETFVQPVVLPLFDPVGGFAGELNEPLVYASTLGVSSITGPFLDGYVDMASVNLAVSTLNGGANGTLSTIAGIDLAVTSTSVCAFRQGTGLAGLLTQGNIVFGTSTLATQFSNTVYQQVITFPSTIRGILTSNQANLVCTVLDGGAQEISTPMTTIQSGTAPFTTFTVYGQSNTPFAFMLSQPDQNVL